MSDEIDRMIESVTASFEALRLRLAVTEDDLNHMHEIYRLCFMEWYDSDNEHTAAFANKVWPHIEALNERFHFKR